MSSKRRAADSLTPEQLKQTAIENCDIMRDDILATPDLSEEMRAQILAADPIVKQCTINLIMELHARREELGKEFLDWCDANPDVFGVTRLVQSVIQQVCHPHVMAAEATTRAMRGCELMFQMMQRQMEVTAEHTSAHTITTPTPQ